MDAMRQISKKNGCKETDKQRNMDAKRQISRRHGWNETDKHETWIQRDR